jgi:hypothetical protein
MNRAELNIYIELYKRKQYKEIPVGQYPDGTYFYMTSKQVKTLELLNDDVTTNVGYGGAARSGKTLIETVAIILDCLSYPAIAWGLGRKELTTLTKTVLVTLYSQLDFYGLKDKVDYNHNNKYNYIEFSNKSKVWLIDTKAKPTDPLNTRFGGLELTRCAVDESNETARSVIIKLFERTGWKHNEKYGLKRKLFECFNPDKTHVYDRFYKPWKNKKEKANKKFIQALPTDNPNPAVKEWIKDMMLTADKVTIQRQIHGNFEYDDNPYALCDYDSILGVFENNHIVRGDKYYITADIARFGSDFARIGVWRGWDLIEVQSFAISKTTEIQAAIEALRFKYQIPKFQCVADEDGVGGGVVDSCGIKGFTNNARPFKEKVTDSSKEVPSYENLQTQCLFGLAKKINEGQFNISADVSPTEKEEILEELATIERNPAILKKLAATKKAKIKEDIGRSPDWRDLMLMRKFFDYNENNSAGFKVRR